MAYLWRIIVYFSRESRYRNMGMRRGEYRRSRPNYLPVVLAALVLMVCCGCLGVVVGLKLTPRPLNNPLASFNPLASQPKATATPDLKAPVPLKTPAAGENGLQVRVSAFQRPLQVQGLTNLEPDQQFVLVSLLVHNSNTAGTPAKIVPTDFQVKGDGGLTYQANPKTVTIDNLLTAQDQVAPGKDLERELIFQIAKDDSGLQLYWTSGKTTRVFTLELQK